MVKKWGLAYMINTEEVPDRRSAGSLAWAGLANTYFWLDPKKRVTGVVLTQILPFADGKALDLLGDFESRRLPERPHASAGQGRIVLARAPRSLVMLQADRFSLPRAGPCPAGSRWLRPAHADFIGIRSSDHYRNSLTPFESAG